MGRRNRPSVNVRFGWIGRHSMKVKIFVSIVTALSFVVVLSLLVKDHNHFFLAAEAIHAFGILVLIYKLTKKKTCSGLSLKGQELTALFLAVRVYCSLVMEGNIHTILDFATFISTSWVIFMIRYKLKSTYIKELDNLSLHYTVVPCAILAILIHPRMEHVFINNVLWAFCVYLESVSVLPQLRLMQNAKIVEPFTAHYVFALGVARLLGFAQWIIQLFETRGEYLFLFGTGYLWILMAFLSEIVQTFILADFCYYYVKSVMYNQLFTEFPLPV